jgi:ribosomal-protein-alanine N-acetyltransferase
MAAVLAAPVVDFAPMRVEDIDAIVAAEERIYRFPWTRGNFADSLAAGYIGLLLHEGGVLAGYGVVMIAVDEAHLLNISILPERQRRGLGSRLLDELGALARSRGATRMLLEVRRSNAAGRDFYERHGFMAIGERRGYYAAELGREDAIVMAKDL